MSSISWFRDLPTLGERRLAPAFCRIGFSEPKGVKIRVTGQKRWPNGLSAALVSVLTELTLLGALLDQGLAVATTDVPVARPRLEGCPMS